MSLTYKTISTSNYQVICKNIEYFLTRNQKCFVISCDLDQSHSIFQFYNQKNQKELKQKLMSTLSESKNLTFQEIADIQTQQGQKCTKKYTFRDRKKIQRNLQTLNFDQCLRKPDKRRLGGWFLKEKQKYLHFLQQNFYTQFMSISQFYDKMAETVRTRTTQQVKVFHQKNMLKYSGIQNVIKSFSQIVEEKKLQKTKLAQKQKANNALEENKGQINLSDIGVTVQTEKKFFPFVNVCQPANIIYCPMNETLKLQNRQLSSKYSIWMENNLIMEQMLTAKKIRQTLAFYQQMNQSMYSQINYQQWNPISNFVPVNQLKINPQLVKNQEDF